MSNRPVPVDLCGHVVHSFDGACEVIEVESGGAPVDAPRPDGPARLHPLALVGGFLAGFVTGAFWT